MKRWILKEETINILRKHNCFTYEMHRQLEVSANELDKDYINLSFNNPKDLYKDITFHVSMSRNLCFEKVEVEDIDPAKVMFIPAKKPNWFSKWMSYLNNNRVIPWVFAFWFMLVYFIHIINCSGK